jgi:hypothetical protein
MPHLAGAPEASTWSTRSAASMNDVDTDQHRHTINDEEGPAPSRPRHPADHVHNADERVLAGLLLPVASVGVGVAAPG